jgi:predicted outer membrane repeat protein
LIICISSIAGVCASDAVDDAIASEDIDFYEISNQGEMEEDWALVDNSSAKTFKDLNTAINGNDSSEVYLDGDYVYNSSSDSSYKSGIKITRAVTVYGNGATIDANNTASIFTVTADGVVFKDINFINAKSTNRGGAINGDCRVEGCNFTNIVSTNYGGAIYGNCNVSDCNFINVSTKYNGGAIYGNAIVYNSNFINASVSYSGGALFNATAINCYFKQNRANQKGGAMYGGLAINCTFEENQAQNGGAVHGGLTARNCNFTNNRASSNGGAMHDSMAFNCIFIGNSALNGGAAYNSSVTSSNFRNNNAIGKDGTKNFGNGGAIYCSNAVECTFINNSAKYGGALHGNSNASNCIFKDNYDQYEGGAMNGGEAINCSFANNKCTNGEGGAAYKIHAVDCNFTNNTAGQYAGAIGGGFSENCRFFDNYAPYACGAIRSGIAIGCLFMGNSAKTCGAFSGNATDCIFINNTALNGNSGAMSGQAYGCRFINNTASKSGGALYGGAFNCTFINNTAVSGGAVSSHDGAQVENCIFIFNYARYGGAISNINAVNCTFYLNVASENGGAINKGTALKCNITNNSAQYGGAIYDGVATDSLFEYNHAEVDGGAMWSGKATSCTFNNNVAEYYGGAIYGGKVSTDSLFANNTARDGNDTYNTEFFINKKSFADLNNLINGNESDEIYLYEDYVFNDAVDFAFENGIVINRTVTVYGNGFTINATDLARIFYVANSSVVFKDMRLVNGQITGEGAAIYGKCLAINCTFEENRALNRDGGGAMYGGDAVNCTFIGNLGTPGGAMMLGNAINCTFIKNKAVKGGALGNSTAINCTFIENNADEGAAIYYGNVTNCNFISNYATRGGAICGADSHAINSVFTGNRAGSGGAIFGPSFTVINCTFVKNWAKYSGGAICKNYLEMVYSIPLNTKLIGTEFNCIVKNCTFISNEANDSGGAVFGEGFVLSDSKFMNNTANNGGAVYYVTVANSIFENNTARSNGGAGYGSVFANCEFVQNHAADGGAIFDCVAENCTFKDNAASDKGNASAKSRVSVSSNVNADDTYNTIFYGNDNSRHFSDLENLIKGNASEIYLDSNYTFNPAYDSDLIEGIEITRPITIYGNGFVLNGLKAARIFKVSSGEVFFRDITFIFAKSTEDGAAINGAATAINCTFKNNVVSFSGGAVNYVTCKNCTFIENGARVGGAASHSDCEGCIFIKNRGTSYGGAIATGSAINCQFFSNYASKAGALYNGYAINCSFTDNHADGSGGAMAGNFQKVVAINCNFTGNYVIGESSDGGAISSGDAMGCRFTNNTASRSGGAISGGDANDCNFTENRAGKYGGAISGFNNTAYGCTFIDNIAKIGGATHNVNVIDSTFAGNWATQYNDTISQGSFENCTFLIKSEFVVSDFISTYNSGDAVKITLKSSNGTQITGTNITVRVYKGGALVDTYYFLSGEEWIVGLNEGQYMAVLSVESPGYLVESKNMTLTVNKALTTVSLSAENVTYCEITVVNVSADADGIAIISIDGVFNKSVNLLSNVISQISFENIPCGNHNITAAFKPNDSNYNESTCKMQFSIFKISTDVNLSVADSVYGEEVIVNVTASEDGKVILKVGNITVEKNVSANIKTSINLGVLKADSYDAEVIFNAGENYDVSNKQKSFTINQVKSEILTLQVQNNTFGENTVINVKTNVDGVITVMLNGVIVNTFNIEANKLTALDLGKCDAKNYDIVLTLDAGSNYTKATGNAKVTVNPKRTTVKLDAEDCIYGKSIIVNVTASENGKVTVNISGNVKTVDVEANKTISVDFGILDAKSYEVNATFDGGKNYQTSYDKASFAVSPKTSSVTIVDPVDCYTNYQNVVIKLKSDTYGTLTVKVGEAQQSKQVAAGNTVEFNFGILDVNNYEVTISLDAGDNYVPYQNITSVAVISKSTYVTLDAGDYDTGENVVVNVTASQNGDVIIIVGNVTYTAQVMANISTSVDLGHFDEGLYHIAVRFMPLGEYMESNATSTIKIFSKIKDEDLNITVPETISNRENSIAISLPEDATGTVTLIIANNTYSFDVKNGVSEIKVPSLDDGSYDYEITYSGDGKYSSFTRSGNLNIQKLTPTSITASAVTTIYNGNKYLVVTLKDSHGKAISGQTLSVNLNGLKTVTTDANGQAKLTTNGLAPEAYYVAVTFDGNDNYTKSTKTVKVTVKKATPKLTAKSKTFKKSVKTKKYTITLKTNQNKAMKKSVVTLKVNKKTYKVKTNSKGKATFKITNLKKKGTFKASVTYNGNKYYNKVTKKNVKIIVK